MQADPLADYGSAGPASAASLLFYPRGVIHSPLERRPGTLEEGAAAWE